MLSPTDLKENSLKCCWSEFSASTYVPWTSITAANVFKASHIHNSLSLATCMYLMSATQIKSEVLLCPMSAVTDNLLNCVLQYSIHKPMMFVWCFVFFCFSWLQRKQNWKGKWRILLAGCETWLLFPFFQFASSITVTKTLNWTEKETYRQFDCCHHVCVTVKKHYPAPPQSVSSVSPWEQTCSASVMWLTLEDGLNKMVLTDFCL